MSKATYNAIGKRKQTISDHFDSLTYFGDTYKLLNNQKLHSVYPVM